MTKRYEFHTHTILSDGELLPIELIRRASVIGIGVVAITDHAGAGNIEWLISSLKGDCDLAEDFGVIAIPGVELTHIPPKRIPALAKRAKKAGADIVVVHGETTVEPVPPLTNRWSVDCPDVDVLAHPGLLTLRDAERARDNGIFIELTSRKGHSLTNGHVARIALKAGAQTVVNTDAHAPGELITFEFARKVATGAGLSEPEVQRALVSNPKALMKRIGY